MTTSACWPCVAWPEDAPSTSRAATTDSWSVRPWPVNSVRPAPRFLVGGQHLHAALEVLSGAGLLALPLHLRLKAVHVHVEPMLAGDLGGELGWEAVGVVEDEGISARDGARSGATIAVGGLAGDHIQQDLVAASEGFGEPLLLEVDDAEDEVAVQGEFPRTRPGSGGSPPGPQCRGRDR